jgi:hypothetical protein
VCQPVKHKQSVSADVPRKIDDQDKLGIQRNQSLGAQKIDDQEKLGVQRNQSLCAQKRQSSTPYYPGATEDKRVLTEISTDSINVPLVKRCVKCVGCKNCKKVHLPDQARQLAQAEIVKKSLSFENGF